MNDVAKRHKLGHTSVQRHAANHFNVLISPQYIEMRVELIRALAPFPEARIAVAKALHSTEHKSVETIEASPSC